MLSVSGVAQIVHAVAHFAIADELAGAPATAAEVAERRRIDPVATDRLLRACASLQLVFLDSQLRFAGTPMLATLRRDAPGSAQGLATTVAALSVQFWKYCKKSPEKVAELSVAVSEMTALVSKEVAQIVDMRRSRVAADIGPGAGLLVHALMKDNPRLHGLVLERAERVATTSLASRWHGMRARLSVVGGDVLSAVPPADLYLLKYILHDWEAAACVRILDNCRRSLHADGRVVVIEMQLEERWQLGLAAHPAVLVAPPGRERTLPEYQELYLAAGLRLVDTTSTRSGMVVMQAVAR